MEGGWAAWASEGKKMCRIEMMIGHERDRCPMEDVR